MNQSQGQVTITPLGGLGEIGMNCLAIHTPESMLVVDCGLMFPDDYLLGVDIVIPRFDFILANKDKLKGVIVTHGHEDHIGALPWLIPHISAPVYGSAFTLALIESKLREHGLDKRVELKPVARRERVEFGDLAVSFFPVCHSIIEGYGLGIETPAGRIVHSGDFKIDPDPMHNHYTDLQAFEEFSREGVLLLMSDSTNVEREGQSINEREITETFREIFAHAPGRIIITLFSSHVQRMQEVFDLAAESGRKVAVNGRSILTNVEIARELGFMKIPSGVYCDTEDLPGIPDEQTVLLVTGSQGEPLSALARIASGEHRQLSIHPGDTVILSSRFIPGNVKAIYKVINNLYRQGAEVFYEKVQSIHASGHAYRDELKQMIETVQPKFFVPMHGEYRHLVKHGRLAQECGIAQERALVIENGSPLTFSAEGVRFEDEVAVDSIYVDGKGVGDVGYTVLKERQLLGGGGLVVVTMVIAAESWEILLGPDVHSKGFVFEQHYSHLLEDSKCIVLDVFETTTPGDEAKLKERIRSSLRRFFRKVLERDPVVLPLIMSI
jgi:ribonuclease J